MKKEHELQIDESIVVGSYDPGTDWSGLGLSDEEIARKLQYEELNPSISRIDEKSFDPGVNVAKQIADYGLEMRREMDNQRKKLDDDRREQQRRREQVERDLAEERRVSRLERELSEERRRNTYPTSSYDRLFNWSLTLLPDYYDYLKRKQLRDALSKLIKRELTYNRSESDLEDKIRNLISDAKIKSVKPKKSKSKSKSKSKKSKSKSRRK
jgi:hypothetical protein